MYLINPNELLKMGVPATYKVFGVIVVIFGLTVNNEAQSCEHDKFQCANGQCIWKWGRCEGKAQCEDHSDEINCSKVACADSQFRCASGQCISISSRCDGSIDCVDKSDEKNCTHEICSTNEFECPEGHCLYQLTSCDYNCLGMGPQVFQTNSSASLSHTCSASSGSWDGSCENGNCPRSHLVCGKGKVCENYNREKIMSRSFANTCQFVCKNGRNCKSTNNKCHFLHQCPTKSDRMNCTMDRLSLSPSKCSFLLTPTSTFNANVQGYPPKFLYTNLQNYDSVSKTEGETVKLLCNVTGHPPPTITWTWDNKNISQWPSKVKYSFSKDNSSLVIRKISEDAIGRYKCVAQNKHGEISEHMHIGVKAFPTKGAKVFIGIGILFPVVCLVVLGWNKYKERVVEINN